MNQDDFAMSVSEEHVDGSEFTVSSCLFFFTFIPLSEKYFGDNEFFCNAKIEIPNL